MKEIILALLALAGVAAKLYLNKRNETPTEKALRAVNNDIKSRAKSRAKSIRALGLNDYERGRIMRLLLKVRGNRKHPRQ